MRFIMSLGYLERQWKFVFMCGRSEDFDFQQYWRCNGVLSVMGASNLHEHITLGFSELIQLKFVHCFYCIENYDEACRLNPHLREWSYSSRMGTYILNS